MNEETTNTDMLTLSMSKKDLEVIAAALENNMVSMQLEFAELERRAMVIKKELDQTVTMLSIMRGRIGS